MTTALRLLCILAHPDDETLGMGGTLARYSAEGVETYLVTATRGQHGWFGAPDENPGPAELGRIRESELRAAARILGIKGVTLLDYMDGELDQADPETVTSQLAAEIRRIRPQVVITFGHDGLYGHPDHIAICQFATAAVVRAAGAAHDGPVVTPGHRVDKLYYRIATPEWMASYQDAFGELVMTVDGVERRSGGWPAWSVSARLDAADQWETVWAAVQQHRSQLPGYERLVALSPERHRVLWGVQEYYRAMSIVTRGRTLEHDLFAGLRRAQVEPEATFGGIFGVDVGRFARAG